MDPQNPNSTDPNNPSITNPVTGAPTSVSPTPIQPDLSSTLGYTPPPVDPIPNAPNPNLTSVPPIPPAPIQSEPAEIITPTSDSSQIPTYTPPSWMNPATVTSNSEPTVPSIIADVNPSTYAPPVEPIPTYIPPSAPTPEATLPPPEPIPVGPNPLTSSNLSQGAPVDLSQLISNAQQQVQTENPVGMPPPSSPPVETVVNANPDAPTAETAVGGGRGFPKWLIGVAAGLLILVIGASSYFILGIGQNNTQTSLPATQTTGRLATPIPIPSPRSVATPIPTAPPATSSAQPDSTPQATSAADLIRLKQQGK